MQHEIAVRSLQSSKDNYTPPVGFLRLLRAIFTFKKTNKKKRSLTALKPPDVGHFHRCEGPSSVFCEYCLAVHGKGIDAIQQSVVSGSTLNRWENLVPVYTILFIVRYV